MKKNSLLLLIGALCFMNCNPAGNDLVQYVNTRIGTQAWQDSITPIGHEPPMGYTFPGVTMPNGLTEWTAHTMKSRAPRVHNDYLVPYGYDDPYISGFTGTHFQSGGALQDYAAVELMPITGALRYRPEERSSAFTHESEIAKPHYYEVTLDDYNIKAQLTASHSAAVMNFTFPAADSAYIIVDAMPAHHTAGVPGKVTIDPDRREVSGTSVLSAWGSRESGYFVVQFDKDFERFGTFHQNLDYPEVIENKYLFADDGGRRVNGLKAVYTQDEPVFGNRKLRSERIDPVVDFNWCSHKPADDFDLEHYGVTWTGKLVPPVSGEYLIGLNSGGNMRLIIDGKTVIDDWAAPRFWVQEKITLEANREYDIKVDFFAKYWPIVKLSWIIPDDRSRLPIIDGNRELESSTKMGAYIGFKTRDGEVVTAKVGTSFISVEQARANLEREIGNASLETISRQAAAVWNKELSRIELPGASDSQKEVFYTALYHSFILPRNLTEDGRYHSPFDGKVYEGFSFTDYSSWDTHRATHPLYVLLKPEFAGDLITGLLNGYDESGWLPKVPCPGHANHMMGTHSDAIIADAYVKGVENFDVEKAAQAVLKNAYEKGNYIAWGRLGVLEYIKQGYVPIDLYRESVARTMEFAYDDFCLARFFQKKGDEKRAADFYQRSKNFKNVLDAETRMVRGRRSDGVWAHPDDNAISLWSGNTKQGADIYRMNYTLFAPHDVEEIVRFLGGADSLAAFLDKFFDTGAYYVGDEYAMQVPYMYNYCGQPWKTQKRINEVVNTYFLPSPGGLPGNDDLGQMSSWYIFSAMGFYPTCPGKAEYQIGVPCLPQTVLNLPGNKKLVIKAENFDKRNAYIQSVTLNGQPHRSTVLRHEDVIKGGELVFVLGDRPNKTWFQ